MTAEANRPRRLRLPRRSAGRIRRDVDDELRFHCEMRARELVEQGVPEGEARRRALLEFGDIDDLGRRCASEDERAERAERRAAWAADFAQDVALAARLLRRSPGFGAIVVLTLALGIGANTAVFGVVHRVLLAPLPYRDADRLVRIYGGHAERPAERGQLSAANLVDVRRAQRSLGSLAAITFGSYTYTGAEHPQQLAGARVSANTFDVLGVAPAIGRAFAPGEDAPGSAPAVVLSHRAWQRLFGGDSSVVGRAITLDGTPRTVVGVLPAAFVWPEGEVDVFVPLDLSRVLGDANRARKYRFLGAIGRLRPASSVERASSDLLAIARRLEREYPDANAGILVNVLPLRDAIVGRARPALRVLMAAAGLVLLIACANIAGLLLSRTVARRQELAIRAALGAGRSRLARQLLAESLLLAVLGGALGVAGAYWGTGALARLGGDALPNMGAVRVDARVLLFAAAAALGSGLLVGVAPALAAARRDLHDPLRDATRSATGTAGRYRVRRALVVGQAAIALMLLVGAGLLVRSLVNLHRVQLGFDPSRLLVFEASLGPRYDTPAKEDQFFAALLARLQALPGVVAAGAGGSLPLAGGAGASLAIEGRPVEGGRLPEVRYTPASDDYFRTLRIPMRRGRVFDRRDRNDTPGVVVLSESAARQFWPGGDAVGARVRLGPDPSQPWSEVIGVVGDVREGGIDAPPRPVAYVSQRQDHWGFARVVVRTTGEPARLVAGIRRELRALDPTLPIANARTMDEIIERHLAGRRLPMLLLSGFAVLALLLAAVGVYGVMAYAVATRTREFGVRVALGATPRSVLGLVMRQGASASLVGLALGVAGAVASARLLAGLLYGVAPLDWPTLLAAGAVLLLVMALACFLPARRATRVDPLVALRSE